MVRAKPTLTAMAAIMGVLLLSLWVVGGCSQEQKARPGTISHWEHQLQWHRSPGGESRTLAAVGPRCLKDRITSAGIRADVLALEQQRGGSPVRGTWQGKDLGSFAPPQGAFLKADSDWLYTTGIDFSSCNDLPCILNQVYGTPDGDQGWKIYGWYLKMGYDLSAKNLVPPNYVFGDEPIKSYLFSDDELTAFWKLSFALPDIYRAMTSLQTFHRVASGYRLDSWSTDTCGDSYGNKTMGYIRLANGCLSLGNPATEIFGGFFYQGVTHEMSHSLDRFLGDGYTDLTGTDEWKAFSGWTVQTVVGPSGVTEHQWHADPAADGFVRDYAASSPAEDWADTIAWFRFDADRALSVSPRKSAFIAQKVFGGRTFSAQGLLKYYEESVAQGLGSQLLDLVNNCLAGAPAGTGVGAATGPATPPGAVSSAAHLSFDMPLPEGLVACLEQGLGTRIGTGLDQLRLVEWEACDLLQRGEADLRARIFARVNADIARLLAQQQALAPLLHAASRLHDALAAQVDPREAYMHCFRQDNPESCYRGLLSDAFDRASQPYAAALADTISTERQRFLDQYPFAQSAAQASQFYRQVFSGADPQLRASASQRWQDCLDRDAGADPAGATVLTQPFSGGSHYVSSTILNCINSAAANDVKGVRDRFIGQLGLTIGDPDTQAYVQNVLLPIYLDALNSKLADAAAAEDAIREQRKPGVIDVLAGDLLGSLNWLNGAGTAAEAGPLCETAAKASFDNYFARVSPDQRLPLHFAAVEDLRLAWAHEACSAKVIPSPSVQQAIQADAARAWSDSLGDLESFVQARARDKSTDCIARSPGTSHGARQRRHSCLLGAWSSIETQALSDWSSTPRGTGFASRRREATQYLRTKRQSLQAAAIQDLDSR